MFSASFKPAKHQIRDDKTEGSQEGRENQTN